MNSITKQTICVLLAFVLIVLLNFSSVMADPLPIWRPPLAQHPPIPAAQPLRVRVQATTARVSNTYGAFTLMADKGLRLTRLVNRAVGGSALAEGLSSRCFLVRLNGRMIEASDFRVIRLTATKEKDGKQRLIAQMSCTVAPLQAVITVTVENSPESVWTLKLTNTGDKDQSIMMVFPLWENLTLSPNQKDNYYFYPYQAGWAGNVPVDLRAEYGGYAWMQVMAAFNPVAGAVIYTYPLDSTGKLKGVFLRKSAEPGRRMLQANEEMAGPKLADPGDELFAADQGISMGQTYPENTLAPGQSMRPAPVVLGIAPGDWRPALFSYKKWAHTWYKHVHTPQWYRSCFAHVSMSDRAGNTGFEKGFYPRDEKKYILGKLTRPTDQFLELALWWNYNPANLTRKDIGPLQIGNMGDYDYNQAKGGLAPFRKTIASAQAKGVRVELYMEATQCWKDTRIGRLHGKLWARMDSPGAYCRDYCVNPGDGWIEDDMARGWQDHLAKVVARALRDTGADAVRFDRTALMFPDYNPTANKHYHGTVASLVNAQAYARLYQVTRVAMRKVNPQAVLLGEHAGSDYLSQFFDGSTSQQCEYRMPSFEKYRPLNCYSVNFWRFCFPEFPVYQWGQTWRDGSREALFNGIAFERSEVTPEQLVYNDRVAALMRENVDALSDLNPQPLVPTLVAGVYANEFRHGQKTIWMLYNKNDHAVSGDLIEVAHEEDSHYVELLHDLPVAAKMNGKQARLSGWIGPREVICLAQLPTRLILEPKQLICHLRVTHPTPHLLVKAYWNNDMTRPETVMLNGQGGGTLDITPVGASRKIIVKLLDGIKLVDEKVLLPFQSGQW